MQIVSISQLKPLLIVLAEEMELYIPKKSGEHFVYNRYNPSDNKDVEFNNIRTCMPVKEFLFPSRELVAVYPEAAESINIQPFAVLGLKYCDLRSIEILDKVFAEHEFEDLFYITRRKNMFIVSSDCFELTDSCFCDILGGTPYAPSGFDLNVSQVQDQFIVEAGSKKGNEFIEKHSTIFMKVTDDILVERDKIRSESQYQLEQNNYDLQFESRIKEIVENSRDSSVYDGEAKSCVECQACTRVCPTCHCFYLYDSQQEDHFIKTKIWDSCMRAAYAEVAGGANPRKALGERLRYRFMHKFSYFFDRYGIEMCVGCGRCIDAEAGEVDIRRVLKRLNDDIKNKEPAKVEITR